MSDTVIKIEGLGKRYLLNHRRSDLLVDALAYRGKRLARWLAQPFMRSDAPSISDLPSNVEEFWALKDLSFDVHQGERVGIVGHNGAGKSTLLKVLSRITAPTLGRVSLKGRVSSILEVGTGFHEDLTGRENIYLNAAILGMTRSEIRRNFDAIVEFSGVEKFLDTPVKRYSSGMRVRLAFAVVAHLNSEILVVDEVLAVGDVDFQKKCMGKMDEVSHKEGRTILFVSHNMGAIAQLCNRVVCMEGGRLTLDSQDVQAGIRQYFNAMREKDSTEWRNLRGLFKSPWFTPLRFGLYGGDGAPLPSVLQRDEEAWVEVEGVVEMPSPALCVGFALYTEEGELLCWNFQTDQMGGPEELPVLEGPFRLRARLPLELLNLGGYRLVLIALLHGQQWLIQDGREAPSASFSLEGPLNASPYCLTRRPGPLVLDAPWSLSHP